MELAAHTLFDTALGPCGIAWGPQGITGVQLPEAHAEATRARLLRWTGPLAVGVPPAAVQAAMQGIARMLAGEPHDLCGAVLDLSRLSDFQRRVYALCRAIPPGHTRTYGALAADLGDPGCARAVGQALGFNPFAPVVPCHRVLAAGHRAGGFSAHGGAQTKLRMLQQEAALRGPLSGELF